MKQIPAALLLILSSVNISAQLQKYDVFLFGKNIGYMTVNRTVLSDGSTYYSLETLSETKILFKNTKALAKSDVTYKNGRLTDAWYQYTENGEIERYSKTTFDGKTYQIHNENGKFSHTEPLTYSLICMYYVEPKTISRIWLEPEGVFCDLKTTGPGAYEYKSPNGNRNVFIYKNGQVAEMEFHLALISVTMKRAV
jgi:antitoxin component YwqK of YwqJK toxin-antitoxin module